MSFGQRSDSPGRSCDWPDAEGGRFGTRRGRLRMKRVISRGQDIQGSACWRCRWTGPRMPPLQPQSLSRRCPGSTRNCANTLLARAQSRALLALSVFRGLFQSQTALSYQDSVEKAAKRSVGDRLGHRLSTFTSVKRTRDDAVLTIAHMQ